VRPDKHYVLGSSPRSSTILFLFIGVSMGSRERVQITSGPVAPAGGGPCTTRTVNPRGTRAAVGCARAGTVKAGAGTNAT